MTSSKWVNFSMGRSAGLAPWRILETQLGSARRNIIGRFGPYDDLGHRTRVRAALATDRERNALPGGQDLIVSQESEIMIPAPFMHPLASRDYGTGNFYEMRIYTYPAGKQSSARTTVLQHRGQGWRPLALSVGP